MAIFESWEDQDWAEWTVDGGPGTSPTFADTISSFANFIPRFGSRAGRLFNSGGGPLVESFFAERSFSTDSYDEVEYFHWIFGSWDKSVTNGHLLQVMNANGDRMIGAGTTNTEWVYTNTSSASATQVYPGDGREHWIRITMSFNDDAQGNAQTVDIEWEDENSGTIRNENGVSLQNTGMISSVQIAPVDGISNPDIRDYFDGVNIEKFNSAPNADLVVTKL